MSKNVRDWGWSYAKTTKRNKPLFYKPDGINSKQGNGAPLFGIDWKFWGYEDGKKSKLLKI